MSAKPAAQLRQMMAEPGLIRAINIYDPLTARIAQDLGFKMIAIGGWNMGAHLCVTEPTLTMTETIETARQITKAVSIPLKVDCGAGFGEPVHVTRTIREVEAAGIACIHIEDQHYPKRAHYHLGRERVIDAEAMVDKIRAAVEARDGDLVLVGRTDAMLTDGVAEGIRRANLYAEAGCDMIEVFPNTVEEARIAAREIAAPLVYVNASGDFADLGRPNIRWHDLEEMGYKLCLDATTVIMSAVDAVRSAMRTYLAEGYPPAHIANNTEIRGYIDDIIGLPEYYEIERRTVERGQA
ncbi:MAG: oxaloacetate decarboxylase [Geminicoccaceae bacterium]